MTAIILATYPAADKLYQLNGLLWDEFASQPPAVSEGIWGGPNSTIWLHNRRYGGPVITPKYLLFDGTGTWTGYDSPAGSFPTGDWYVSAIHGSVNGSIVYAAVATQGASGRVHKFEAGTWTELSPTERAGSIWCDETGQHVWFSCGDGDGSAGHVLYHSADYGTTWIARRAQMASDLGVSSGIAMNGVWGTDANNVYVASKGSPYGGFIAKWNGTSFEFVSTGGDDTIVLMTSPWSNGTTHIAYGGWTNAALYRDEGGSLVNKAQPGYYDSARGRGAIGLEDGSVIAAVFTGIIGNPATGLVSFDQGDTWVPTPSVWGTSGGGLQGLTVAGWVKYSAPYLADQSPAPDSTHNPPDVPVSLAIRDDQGDLTSGSVRVYINGTLAWIGGARLAGFVGDIEAVTDAAGYAFGLTPAAGFEPGLQTVRVVASDAEALALDETYTFSTVAAVREADDQDEQDRTVGIDLYLDETHDLVVSDHDLQQVAGADEVAQHLLVGLRLFRGEWYLDEEAGVPYYRHVLTDAPRTRVIEGLLRQEILGDADIESLAVFEMELDRLTRKLSVDFRAASIVGPVAVSAVFS